ncbi:hypothetical protein DV735_g3997, partial [Chaetothyriales sp. CBS 134920]
MAQAFKGQVAIVTGGNSGIGLATVIGFLQQGAQVAVLDLADSPSEHLPQTDDVKYFKSNVSSSDSVDQAIKAVADAFGHIDILVNCAGIMDGMERAGDTTNANWDRIIAVNLSGPLYTARAVIPYFLKNERQSDPGAPPVYDTLGNPHPAPPPSKGVIVNICSVAAIGGGSAGAAYTAAKHGLLGLSRSTSWSYRKEGIRTNVVIPGGVATNIYANSKVQLDPAGMAAVKPFHDLSPNVTLSPGSIASAILWLAAPSNLNVNGAEIVVDGGWTTHNKFLAGKLACEKVEPQRDERFDGQGIHIPTPATMAAPEKESPLKAVQLEALVVMKITKHCSSRFPTIATGSLVGMENNGLLEVTNSSAFPILDLPPEEQYDNQVFNTAAAAPRAKSNIAYQNEYIRMLKEVNVDANNVGWYTSANLGNFVNSNFIQNQFFYQKDLNEKTVALVYDVSRSAQGLLSLRAFRLSPQFMAAFKENKFTTENLQKSGLKYSDILQELPIQIHNSHLITTFLNQIPASLKSGPLPAPTSAAAVSSNPAIKNDVLSPTAIAFPSLTLNPDPFLSQTADNLLDAIETHHVEANNFSYYSRALAREQAKIQQWQAKRKAENAARALSKQPPLPEDEWQKLFKLPTEPSRLESLLNSRQAEQYARQVDGFVAATTGKILALAMRPPKDTNMTMAMAMEGLLGWEQAGNGLESSA